MEQSQGFVVKGQEHKVYKFKRSIYGVNNLLDNGTLNFIKP